MRRRDVHVERSLRACGHEPMRRAASVLSTERRRSLSERHGVDIILPGPPLRRMRLRHYYGRTALRTDWNFVQRLPELRLPPERHLRLHRHREM
jgi:hypothetical protein